MSRNTRLIAVTAAVVILAGGGAALAAVELTGSSDSTQASPAPVGFGDEGASNGTSRPGTGGGLGRDLGGGRYRGDGIVPGGGPGGPGGGFFGSLGAAATYLGVSTAALQSDLQSGKTLAQVAKANGKTTAGLVAAMVAAQKKQLDAAVAAGRLTAAQAQQIAPFLSRRIIAMVNGTRPGGLGGVYGRGFGGGDDPGGDDGGSGSSGSGGSGTFGSAA